MRRNTPEQWVTSGPLLKNQALERETRDGIPQTAKDLGIAETTLYLWCAKQRFNERGIFIKYNDLRNSDRQRRNF